MLLGLLTLVFFLSRLLVGDAAALFLSPNVPAHVVDQIRTQFGLDRSLFEQYYLWMVSAIRGDLGYSFMLGMPVTEVLFSVVPNSIILGGVAMIIEIIIAVVLAMAALTASGKTVDRLIGNGTLIVYSLPSFWVGLILVIVFSYQCGLFPSSHMHASDAGDYGMVASIADLLWHLALPALTVAIPGAAGLARFLRTRIQTTLQQEFVLNASSLGQSRKTVFLNCILPNSAGPLVSQVGIEFGLVLTGVLVTEVLFSWPGMGRLAIAAIFARDYPLILGCTLVGGIVVTAGNLLADIAQGILDPRVRIEKERVA